MNKERYIVYCLSRSIIIVFKQEKKKRKVQILPCQRYSVSAVQFQIPFLPGMVYGQMPWGKGGGGGHAVVQT